MVSLLTDEQVSRLVKWYKYYHKLYTCYKWRNKKLKRVKLSLNMTSIGLVVIGGIAGSVTANPIVLGCISAPGVLIQGYLSKANISRKIEMSKYAYTSYKKVLTLLRSFLRGISYDETVFLSDLKVIDDSVCDLCDPLDGMVAKYDRRYGSI